MFTAQLGTALSMPGNVVLGFGSAKAVIGTTIDYGKDPRVQVDRKAPPRSRQHQEQVAAILNGLQRAGQLVETSEGWRQGYVPVTAQTTDFDPTKGVPGTVGELLDRIVVYIKSINTQGV